MGLPKNPARALSHLNSAYVLIQAAPNSVSSSRISPTATTRTCSGSWPPNLNPYLPNSKAAVCGFTQSF